MGRQFALMEHQQLQVLANPNAGTDDEIRYALSLLDEATLGTACAELVEQALDSGATGSSAAGKRPKITAGRAEEARFFHRENSDNGGQFVLNAISGFPHGN